LDVCGLSVYKVKLLKSQRRAFLDEARELSESEAIPNRCWINRHYSKEVASCQATSLTG
jgi:hypothetical protein